MFGRAAKMPHKLFVSAINPDWSKLEDVQTDIVINIRFVFADKAKAPLVIQWTPKDIARVVSGRTAAQDSAQTFYTPTDLATELRASLGIEAAHEVPAMNNEARAKQCEQLLSANKLEIEFRQAVHEVMTPALKKQIRDAFNQAFDNTSDFAKTPSQNNGGWGGLPMSTIGYHQLINNDNLKSVEFQVPRYLWGTKLTRVVSHKAEDMTMTSKGVRPIYNYEHP